MKILVLSDLHLGRQFHPRKFAKLVEIVAACDKLILNGDFWEGFRISFDAFINSPWQQLFPLLALKNTVYIYGNHDPHYLADARVGLFSHAQTYSHVEVIEGKTYVFEHGQRFCPAAVAGGQLNLTRQIRSLISHYAALICFWTPHAVLARYFCAPLNGKIKQAIQSALQEAHVYICGHTHAAEIDLKNRFVNSGACCYGFLHYLVIEDGEISAYKTRY